MSKPVATASEVSAIPSSGASDKAGNTGAWTAGPSPLSVITASKLNIQGGAVALAASQTFTFSGVNGSGTAVTYPSPVILNASQTKLRSGGQFVLVDGDAADDTSAALATPVNEIRVSSSRKLRTG
jgi:hypothetical protein